MRKSVAVPPTNGFEASIASYARRRQFAVARGQKGDPGLKIAGESDECLLESISLGNSWHRHTKR